MMPGVPAVTHDQRGTRVRVPLQCLGCGQWADVHITPEDLGEALVRIVPRPWSQTAHDKHQQRLREEEEWYDQLMDGTAGDPYLPTFT